MQESQSAGIDADAVQREGTASRHWISAVHRRFGHRSQEHSVNEAATRMSSRAVLSHRAPLSLQSPFEGEVIEESESVELGESEMEQDDVFDALIVGTHGVLNEPTDAPRGVIEVHEAMRPTATGEEHPAA